jgi:beta-lactamase class A
MAQLEASRLGADRLPAGIGPDWRFIGRTGGGPSFEGRQVGNNHVGIAVHKTSGRRIAIVSFLKDAGGDNAARAASHAAVGAAVAAAWANG